MTAHLRVTDKLLSHITHKKTNLSPILLISKGRLGASLNKKQGNQVMQFVCVVGDGGCGAYCVAFNFCSCLSLWIRWGFLCFVQLGQTQFFG